MPISPHIAIDKFRLVILDAIVADWRAFRKAMVVWRPEINRVMPSPPTGRGVFDFGEKLYEVWRSNPGPGTRAGGSEAGIAFQGLLVWYLNMLLFGTDVLVSPNKKELLPQSIRQAMAVSISNNPSNTEADLVAYSVPGGSTASGGGLGTQASVESKISGNLKKTSVTVLQLKTNWNENAQIPMLWDLIYRGATLGTNVPIVTVGSSGINPGGFANFRYGFATCPGKKQADMKPTQLPALRVQSLSGGNYWLQPSRANVALNINEFPGSNFPKQISSTASGSLVGHIDANLGRQQTLVSDFVNFRFA